MLENVGTAEQEMGQRMCQQHDWSVKEEREAGLDWLLSLLTPKNKGSVTCHPKMPTWDCLSAPRDPAIIPAVPAYVGFLSSLLQLWHPAKRRVQSS